ncbi:coiled-coil domain-containing protein 55-domain containing protein [Boletus reticuloceps]|uniref:Coiled-coil domain-containing protein 55-domain containing protein n=1 Tax=Boletus reticuloceps TaxID=495285 RepID=A0A8I2YSV0_9AGAM|nr:coiled-coil domain-containing protein 55-domain containing protein [Boletus reticuloceps]
MGLHNTNCHEVLLLPSQQEHRAAWCCSSSHKASSVLSLDDEDTQDVVHVAPSSKDAHVNKTLLAGNMASSKATQKRMEQEVKIDATVYQYDEVWDRMQEAKERQKVAKESDAKQRKVEGLLNSAATRRLDRLRAEEKMLQLEREMEGDEFADKEAFVTQAYKDQMAEVRNAEEEERQKEDAEKKKQKGAVTGMAYFYRKLLEDSEQKHEETVAAVTERKPLIGPRGPSLTITKPADFTPVSDVELARLAHEQGKVVELNDDNQIVDKRELLSAGLNLSAPNTRRVRLQMMTKKSEDKTEPHVHRAVGTTASRREITARRTAEIHQQMEEEHERQQAQKERDAEESRQRIVAKRNSEVDVEDARVRYLERKRRKLEEGAATTVDTET